jgi:ATP-dependent Clp protease ATP-binding subunit ClpC
MYERFTDRARKVMLLANQEAQRFNHEYIGTEHILLGLVAEGTGTAAKVLKDLEIDLRKIRNEVEKIVQSGPDMVTMGKLPQTPRAKKVIEYAFEEGRKLGHDFIGTEHLLLGLLREEEGVAGQVLMSLGLKLAVVREAVLDRLGNPAESPVQTPALDTYAVDLTEQARRGELDPVIGRASEIEVIVQVLRCRGANNLVLVGPSGVGKSALVRALAQRIAAGNAPLSLHKHRLVTLDFPKLMSAGMGREQPLALGNVVRDLRNSRNIIVCLDRPRNWFSSVPDNDLMAAILLGEVQCIATATAEEYRDLFVHDPALERRFQRVIVRPPSAQEAVEMLRGVRQKFETYHQVVIADEVLAAAVELSEQHLPDRVLPAKAFQLLDRTAARVCCRSRGPTPNFSEIEARILQLTKEKEEAVSRQEYNLAARLLEQVNQLQKQKEALSGSQQSAVQVARVEVEDVKAVIRQMADSSDQA